MALFVLAVIIFVIADIIIRVILKRIRERHLRKERAKALEVSLQLDFSKETKTLKRAEVENPKARILCVDDEEVILSSFRKILVLEGYSVDTVESGKEALTLIRIHHYDFVFTDLKMPEMDGVEVTKAVKHLRPDIDVVIITGFATVQTAVECMKFGALDYVEKPFTEDELLEFTRKCLIKREEKIKKELKPKVHISHVTDTEFIGAGEFAIPGGVFISACHVWASINQDGLVNVGIDDFAQKIIGKIDGIEFPNKGMVIKKGQTLFSLKQGSRSIPFSAPVSGTVAKINRELPEDYDVLKITPYEKNWICAIDADNLDTELSELKIGKTAVTMYEEDIEKCEKLLKKLVKEREKDPHQRLSYGEMEKLDDFGWDTIKEEFFLRE